MCSRHWHRSLAQGPAQYRVACNVGFLAEAHPSATTTRRAHLRALAERAGRDEQAHGGPLLREQRDVERALVVGVLLGHRRTGAGSPARRFVRQHHLRAGAPTSFFNKTPFCGMHASSTLPGSKLSLVQPLGDHEGVKPAQGHSRHKIQQLHGPVLPARNRAKEDSRKVEWCSC